MTADRQQSDKVSPSARVIMPPHLVLRDFMEDATVAGLLEYACAHAAAFAPTKTGHFAEAKIDPDARISVMTRDLGPFRPILETKVLGLLPDLTAQLRMTPVEAAKLELQLVAHNDGAFYKRHIDTQTAASRDGIRVLSGVYYFHAKPKAFSGGALRLYAIGDPAETTFVDIEPAHNTLLVFPSWAPHEVMPVSCPPKRFSDSRFAVNCWVLRK